MGWMAVRARKVRKDFREHSADRRARKVRKAPTD